MEFVSGVDSNQIYNNNNNCNNTYIAANNNNMTNNNFSRKQSVPPFQYVNSPKAVNSSSRFISLTTPFNPSLS